MRQRETTGLVALLAASLATGAATLAGCRPSETAGGLVVAGSTSVQPLAELIAEHYEIEHPNRRVNVQGGGSSAGIRAAQTGAAEIGMSSRDLKQDEKGLKEFLIGRDAIVLIVHPSNPVRSLSRKQVQGIFAGRIRRWSDLGGQDTPITVITREEGSGTRGAFEEMVMEDVDFAADALVQDSTGAVRAIVASDPNAIGYISFGMVSQDVAAVTLDGVEPARQAVIAGKYPLTRPFLFLTKGEPSEAAREFIDYVLGPKGQELVAREGYVPVGGEDP